MLRRLCASTTTRKITTSSCYSPPAMTCFNFLGTIAPTYLTSHPMPSRSILFHTQRRYYCESKAQKEQTAEEKAKEDEKKNEFENMFFLKREYVGLRQDIREFPDIYNYINVFQMVLFTVFCLSSTGSQGEADWWVKWCGIGTDGKAFLAPFLHVFLTTNFLSMAFAMLLIHNLGHTVMTAVGANFLFKYLSIVAITSGFAMLAMNYQWPVLSQGEFQYGPWDMIMALFVASSVSAGYTPFQLLSSFNGWVKYASFLGAAVILYYDWQPCLFGLLIAVGLHKSGVMRIPSAAAASA